MKTWILAPLFALAAHACSAQVPAKHSLRSSVRGNDSVRVVPSLPWVTEYVPPSIYDTWWKEIAECEKMPLPIALTKTVKWVQVNSVTFRVGRQQGRTYGLADVDHTTIYVALPSVLDPSVIKHEMVHMLDWWYGEDEGDDYHPQDRFEVCGLSTYYKTP